MVSDLPVGFPGVTGRPCASGWVGLVYPSFNIMDKGLALRRGIGHASTG